MLLAGTAAAESPYPGESFSIGGLRGPIVVADLNGDLIPDLIATDAGDETAGVALGRGDGTFQATVTYPAYDADAPRSSGNVSLRPPVAVAVGDVDGDAVPDLVTGNSDTDVLTVLTGVGDGTFADPQSVTFPSPSIIELADLDGDGSLDLVATARELATVRVALGVGDGTFGTPESYGVGSDPAELLMTDLDGDGAVDAVTANRGSEDLSVLLGLGDGNFGAEVRVTLPRVPQSLAAADFDGDGTIDLATGGRVLLGQGDGTFASSDFADGRSSGLAAGDVDGDGFDDIVMNDRDGTRLFEGDGSGAFSDEGIITPDSGDLTLADLNRDGVADLIHAALRERTVNLGRGSGNVYVRQEISQGNGQGYGAVAVADLNSDDIPDVVTGVLSNTAESTVEVRLSTLDGPLTRTVVLFPFSTGTVGNPNLTIADLNDDSRPDLLAREFGGQMAVLLGTDDQPFGAPVLYDVGRGFTDPLVADLNGDGTPDVVATNRDETATVLLGTPDGLVAADDVTTGIAAEGAAVADLNGDGDADLALVQPNDSAITILTGNGDGTFEAPNRIPVDGPADGITIGDLNDDSVPDLVTGLSDFPGSIATLVGNGDGTFEPIQRAEGETRATQIADVDDDGVADLVAVDDQFVTVRFGTGDGTFDLPRNFAADLNSGTDLALEDMDGDGLLDVVAVGQEGRINLLLNNDIRIEATERVRFGDAAAGQTVQRTVELRAVGESPVFIGQESIVVTGSSSADFAISDDPCSGRSIPRGGACAVTLTYTAGEDAGPVSAELAVATGATQAPLVVQLSGTSLGDGTQLPGGDINPDLDVELVRDATAGERNTVVLQVTNTGATPVDLEDFSIGVVGPADVALPEQCDRGVDVIDCALGTLDAGQTVTLTLVVTPTQLESVMLAVGDARFLAQPDVADEPVGFAIQASQQRFDTAAPDTASETTAQLSAQDVRRAAHVVLSRDDVFADSLSASILTVSSPLLYTTTDGLPAETLAEIRRVLGTGGLVYILGGENAVAPVVAQAVREAGFEVQRVAGPSRVETSVAVADVAVGLYGNPDVVAVGRADGAADNPTAAWADAVAAGGWSAQTYQPILLTPTDSLHPATRQWVSLRPGLAVNLLGGVDALSEQVATDVDLSSVASVARTAGPNRYATAVAVAADLWPDTGADRVLSPGGDEDGWAYTLAAAGLSADSNRPILLVEADRLPAETQEGLCSDDGAGRDLLVVPTTRVGPDLQSGLDGGCPG